MMSENPSQNQNSEDSFRAQKPWQRVAPPLAKRLNRNVLTVAAIFFGLVVIVALVTMRPSKDEKESHPDSAEVTVPPSPPPTILDEQTEPFMVDRVTAPPEEPVEEEYPPVEQFDEPRYADRWTDYASSPPNVVAASPSRSSREEAYMRALRSAPLADIDGERSASSTSEPSATALGSDEPMLPELTDVDLSAFAATTQSTSNASESSFIGSERTSQPNPMEGSQHQRFLHEASLTRPQTVTSSIESPAEPYILQAGTVIPGLLVTGISSDLPGGCVGQVSRNVYDSRSQRVLLIPQGSKLICRYDDEIRVGQDRVLIAWTRIIFPDGRSIALPGLGITDEQGAAGVKDRVDNHYRKVFGNAVLLSLIAAGTQLSQPRDASSPYGVSSPRQVAAGAVGQELSAVATEIIRRNINIQPTISIRPGTPFNVFLNGDIAFSEPYTDQR